MTTQKQVPQVERAALTILRNSNSEQGHPVLRYYIRSLMTNPSESRTLNAYADSNEWRQHDPEIEQEIARRGWNTDDVLGAVLGDAAYPDSLPSYWRYYDEANARLAIAVANYRRHGRPESDTTDTIQGMGGPLATVTTSLAAAIAEYVANIQNCWAIRLEEQGY